MEPVAGTPELGDPLRYEILGPLRVWHGDQEINLGPGKQRAVLAVLLVNANRPVPTTRMVDAVWPDDPPQNGPNVVQKHIAGLRRLLEPERSPRSPGKRLTLTDAGYLLRVPPGRLDLDVFHEAVRQARAARAAGDLAEAAAGLRRALGLWRDEALSGLAGTLFDTTRDRLGESRAAALAEWAEVELELGRHSQLAPELVRLAAEFPLREELRGLLMLALYRCGRQAEALAAYRDARGFLNQEFGIEPGERLQALHQRILQADPTLLGALGAASPVAPAAPDPAPGPPAAPAAPHRLPPAPHLAAAPRPTRRWGVWLARVIGVLVPLASCGTLTWAVIAYLAGRRGSWLLGLAAAAYFALTTVAFAGLATGPVDGPIRPLDVAAMLAMILAQIGGAVHVAVLDPGRD